MEKVSIIVSSPFISLGCKIKVQLHFKMSDGDCEGTCRIVVEVQDTKLEDMRGGGEVGTESPNFIFVTS